MPELVSVCVCVREAVDMPSGNYDRYRFGEIIDYLW